MINHVDGMDRNASVGAPWAYAYDPNTDSLVRFAINYVPKGGEAMVKEFGGGGTLKGADRFLPGAWTTLKTGAPTLVDSVGVIDCQLDDMIERHGTIIAIGRVVAFTASTKDPLISFRGGYI